MSDESVEGRFVLGAAQLGMAYGAVNQVGDLDDHAVSGILNEAWKQGIRWLDTAIAYGESEARIGRHLRKNAEQRFRIVTKLSKIESISSSIEESIERLGQVPDVVMLHNPAHLSQWDTGLGRELISLREKGKTHSIGVSIYSPEEFRRAIAIDEIESIQAPFSVFDQRLVRDGLFEIAERKGKTVYLRSLYLQGLLLTDVDVASKRLSIGSEWFREWSRTCKAMGRSQADVALAYALQASGRSKFVLGSETPEQIRSNAGVLKAAWENPLTTAQLDELEKFAQVPTAVVDPRSWPKQ